MRERLSFPPGVFAKGDVFLWIVRKKSMSVLSKRRVTTNGRHPTRKAARISARGATGRAGSRGRKQMRSERAVAKWPFGTRHFLGLLWPSGSAFSLVYQ